MALTSTMYGAVDKLSLTKSTLMSRLQHLVHVLAVVDHNPINVHVTVSTISLLSATCS